MIEPSATLQRVPVRFELPVAVEAADIDALGHVNNVVYVRWVQDAAVAHWRAAAPAELQAQLVWVVLRHEIDYVQPALPGDRVVAVTWVGEAMRVRFERFTEIAREPDRKVLARARTVWCPIDISTGRPRRLDASLHDHFSTPSGRE